MDKKILIHIFLVFIFKQIVWISLVPVFHTPDEQAHFAQVAFWAEKGRQPEGEENDLTKEIRQTEKLLGTERDRMGINKFTYHPEYRLEYTDTNIGKYEKEIDSIKSKPEYRQMVKKEASRYSPFYYQLLSVVYRIFYQNNIFVRIFALRFFQMIFSLGTVYTAFLIAKSLFPQKTMIQVSLPVLVSFQPMFSFVSSGINSDNIANFIFSLFLLLCLKIIKSRLSAVLFTQLILTVFFSLYVKPQFFIVLPLAGIILSFAFYKKLKRHTRLKWLILLSLWLAVFFLARLAIILNIAPSSVFFRTIQNIENLPEFILYIPQYVLPHAYREVLPWYWGVYKWLGVTYPRFIHRIINWIGLFSLLGFVIWLIQKIRAKDKWPFWGILFLSFVSIVFFFAIYFYDWLEFSRRSVHLGVQGRYLFPTIIPHLLIILLGASAFVPSRFFKTKYFLIKTITIFMILLNFIGLFTIANSYYTIWPLSTFIFQASQYKPFFSKGLAFVGICFIYLFFLSIFLLRYIYYPYEKKAENKL